MLNSTLFMIILLGILNMFLVWDIRNIKKIIDQNNLITEELLDTVVLKLIDLESKNKGK